MYICFLFLVDSRDPAFDINVRHFFSGYRFLIQNNIHCVPDDDPQNITERNNKMSVLIITVPLTGKVSLYTLNTKQAKFCQMEAYSLAFLASMLNGGPGGPRDFGKMSTHI